MDTICDVKAPSWSGEDVAPMAEFLRGYADFVLRRTTQFGPDFRELLVREITAGLATNVSPDFVLMEAYARSIEPELGAVCSFRDGVAARRLVGAIFVSRVLMPFDASYPTALLLLSIHAAATAPRWSSLFFTRVPITAPRP